MVREIMRNEEFLKIPSRRAHEGDLPIAADLLDTLAANAEGCVGMAANMIGESVAIIAFEEEDSYSIMLNPEIIKRSDPYTAEEGCLSLQGTRKARRYRNIKVKYQNAKMQLRFKSYSGFTAQIIQHELDHINGIII